jgi:hypothetical protein
MCVLSGFPTTLAKSKSNTSFPFGIWFANPHTLYLADEGDGTPTFSTASGQYTDAAARTTAGLQKWVFDPAAQSWQVLAPRCGQVLRGVALAPHGELGGRR